LLIADDHEILREGLKYVVSLSRNISVVGEAADAESALQLCRTTAADVLLLDVSMPGPGVLETIKSVRVNGLRSVETKTTLVAKFASTSNFSFP
jgi:DNA-binding NarL/FixJ family response regulator